MPPFNHRNLDELVLDSIFGFILNLPSNYKLLNLLPTPFKTKHWIALRKVQPTEKEGEGEGGFYYNFDSNLKGPERIGTVGISSKF